VCGETSTYVSWANDGAVPVGHEDIVAVLETVGTRSVADALLSLFELLEQAKVAWNWQIVFWGEESHLYQLDVKEKEKKKMQVIDTHPLPSLW
jgi:hypothetical protein